MGERKRREKSIVVEVRKTLEKGWDDNNEPMSVVTPGGRIQVRWDTRASATAMGQLAFFAEFLDVAGLFERWVQQCPLQYTSPNAPAVRDVLGTWLLSILDGQRRYAHVASLRGDAVAPQILGMSRVVGDESLRRALALIAPTRHAKHTDEQRQEQERRCARAEQWMSEALLDSVREALSTAWILDIDTTIKTLFGHQGGAEVSYNPHKPGRPSHAIHTYWIANLRLVLQANEVAIRISLEVSNLVDSITTKSGSVAYRIGTRSAATMLQLKDGENQVLAGLINNEDRTSGSKVPGIGSLPILGRLFGSTRDSTDKTEIVLSITPHLVRNIQRPAVAASEFNAGTETSFRRRPDAPVKAPAPLPPPAPAIVPAVVPPAPGPVVTPIPAQ